MAFNGPKSSSTSQVICIYKFTKKSQDTNNGHQFHHKQRLSCLLSTWLTIILLSTLPLNSNCSVVNDDFLERLPLQSIVSVGTDTSDGLYTSQEFTRTCYTKINYKEMCAEYGPNCEFRFEWSYPESLLELVKKGFDPRIRIQDDLPVTLKYNQDYQVYASHLLIANIGYSHQGIWSCNFKFINNDNGKIDSWQQMFTIEIVENGVRGSACLTNDHCSSYNCQNDECVCDAEEPILVGNSCKKAPKLGEDCADDSSCAINIEDAQCLCSSTSNSSLSTTDYCKDHGKCQCPPSYIAVNQGLGSYRCLKKARINEHCYRSQQCEVIDSNTYCSFKSRCTCRSGETCSTPSIRLCTNKADCNNINEYCGNGRCQTVKDLNEACSSSDECDPNARCSSSRGVCVCSPGFKVSPVKMICIPEDVCYNDLDCDHGFCSENSTCIQGVQLSGDCYITKQCQAMDDNSYCEDETSQCTCGPGYYISSQGVCLLKGKCRVNQDCNDDQNGLCYYEECVYTKKLHSSCKESRQCFLSTKYSYCDISGNHGECECLNGPEDNKNACPELKKCESNSDCSKIINSYCDDQLAVCTCNDDYSLNIDGYCYKKSLSPSSDKDSFWINLWNDYYIYIIAGAALSGFLISLLICLCCKLCNSNQDNRQPVNRKTRGGFDRPVSGVYVPNPPSAPPPPYQPPAISSNY